MRCEGSYSSLNGVCGSYGGSTGCALLIQEGGAYKCELCNAFGGFYMRTAGSSSCSQRAGAVGLGERGVRGDGGFRALFDSLSTEMRKRLI